jgi:iron complex outermembrane recepter protein
MAHMKLPSRNRVNATVLASAISAILGTGAQHTALAQDDRLEEVLVTGSRILRRDLSASSPIMTVDAERLENSSTISIESILNQMPQFTPAQTQFSAQGQIQTSPTLSLGIGSVNLRGVSTNRTLTLLDGRRAQPTNASLIVDLNTIPSAAIERIETITGGASAVYGADALAGVVNFVLKDNFDGVALDFQTSFTEAGDAEETRFSGLVGLNSTSGNANLLLGVEWYDRKAGFQKNRDFYVDGWNDETNSIATFFPSMPNWLPTADNAPSQAAVDAMFPQYAPGTINPVQPFFFNLDGTPFVRQNNEALGFDWSQLDRPYLGDGFYGLIRRGDNVQQVYNDGPMSTPLVRRSAFGKARVDINDNMRAFVQANFSRSSVETFSAGPPPAYFGWAATIPNDERSAIPSALQTLLDSRPDADATYSVRRGLDFLGHFGPQNSSDVYQIMVGLEGQIPNRDWTWEAFYSSGETNTNNAYPGLPSIQKWQAVVALPEFGAGGQVVVGNYNTSCTSGLPIFQGTTATMTQDCANSILGFYTSMTVLKQDIAEANLQGRLADMRAGELRFAAGVSTRVNSYTYTPLNPQSSVFDQPLGLFPSNAADGKTKVHEIYGELLVPVVERLNLELGYRYSDYDSAAGTVGTYKTLFDWSATDRMRVRGGYQLANRAPNSAELFQSETTIFQTGFVGDPCQNNTTATWGNVPGNPNRAQVQQLCNQLIGNPAIFGPPGSDLANDFVLGDAPFTGINGIQAGNPNLRSEEAKTWTLGVVLQGIGGLDRLTASVDFYNIEVTDAIASFTGNTIYEQCFNVNGISNPGYTINDPAGFCGLITRSEATGGAGPVYNTYLNTGLIETAGIDMSVNWGTELRTGGTFYINSLLNILDKFNTQEKPGDPILEWKDSLGQGGQYKYRLNSTVGYNFSGGAANVGLRWRHLPEVRNATLVSNPNALIFPTKSYDNLDLFAGYRFNDRYQLRGGIDNLLDTKPAVVGATPASSASNSTLAGYYDTLGRRGYVALRMQF